MATAIAEPSPAVTSTEGERLYSRKAVAARYGVDPQTVRNWQLAGKLPGFKLGKNWRFREADVLRLMQPARPA